MSIDSNYLVYDDKIDLREAGEVALENRMIVEIAKALISQPLQSEKEGIDKINSWIHQTASLQKLFHCLKQTPANQFQLIQLLQRLISIEKSELDGFTEELAILIKNKGFFFADALLQRFAHPIEPIKAVYLKALNQIFSPDTRLANYDIQPVVTAVKNMREGEVLNFIEKCKPLIQVSACGFALSDVFKKLYSHPEKIDEVLQLPIKHLGGNSVSLLQELDKIEKKERRKYIEALRSFCPHGQGDVECLKLLSVLKEIPPQFIEAVPSFMGKIAIQGYRFSDVMGFAEMFSAFKDFHFESINGDFFKIFEGKSEIEKAVIARVLQRAFRNGLKFSEVVSWFKEKVGEEGIELAKLPFELQWRLGIDRQYHNHEEGPHYFDKDQSPGYLEGILRCWKFLDKLRGCKMNSYFLEMIHDILVEGAQNEGKPLLKGYSFGYQYGTCFNKDKLPLLSQEWDKEKLILTVPKSVELEGSECQKYLSYVLEMVGKKNKYHLMIASQFQRGDERKIDQLFDHFYREAAKGKSMNEKYEAVVRCLRALQIFHAFPDANGRTICFALCHFLLNQIGSKLAILPMPSIFDGSWTLNQMAILIKQGVAYFEIESLLATQPASGASTQAITSPQSKSDG